MSQATTSPRLGVAIPQTDLDGDPGALRAFAQAAEELGFDHLVIYDHVLGARPKDSAAAKSLFHDPFVLYGYLDDELVDPNSDIRTCQLRCTPCLTRSHAPLNFCDRSSGS